MEVLIVTVLLSAAGFYDVKEGKIPNFLIAAGWIAALGFRLFLDGVSGGIWCVITVLLTILICFPLFAFHVIGAGDIKLLSVVGAMHGCAFLWQVVLVWLTVAAGVSVTAMFRRRLVRERLYHLWNYLIAGRVCKIPYYDKERDGTQCTIVLAPIMAFSYLLVQIGRWNGFC